MRKLIGLGLAAAVAGAGLAVSAVGAPAAETTKIVYHSSSRRGTTRSSS